MFTLDSTGNGPRTGSLQLGAFTVRTPAVFVRAPFWTVDGITPPELAALGVAGISIDPGAIQARFGTSGLGGQRSVPMPVLAGWPLAEAFADGSRLQRFDGASITFGSRHDGSKLMVHPQLTGSIARSLGAQMAIAPGLPATLNFITGRKDTLSARADSDWQIGALEEASAMPMLARLTSGFDPALRAEPFLGAISTNPSHFEQVPSSWLRVLDSTPGTYRGAQSSDRADIVLFDLRTLRNTAIVQDTTLNLLDDSLIDVLEPLDASCDCPACRHSTGYLHHLLSVGEVLGPMLVTLHNARTLVRMLSMPSPIAGAHSVTSTSKVDSGFRFDLK